MEVIEALAGGGHEQVVFAHDGATGLRAIVAIHSRRLGPALGGTRFFPYRSGDDALADVLRLSAAMTFKMAVADLPLGGGKAVIVGDPATDRTDDLVRAYGRLIESLGGRYLTAEDVGTTQADMDLIRTETAHVTGTSPFLGGSGDPSTATADGVLWAMRAVARHLWDDPDLAGRHVAVSGVGKVGTRLAQLLVGGGARVTVADVDPTAVERAVAVGGPVAVADPERLHAVECDIFSPCAMGGVLNPATIPELRCAAVVGCANNQLAGEGCDEAVAEAGILYAPDFVANAGGVINIAQELVPGGYDPARAEGALAAIFDTTTAVLERAEADGVTPDAAASRMAAERLARDPG